MHVMSIVRGVVPLASIDELASNYRQAAASRPDTIITTSLLVGDQGTVAIATVWRDRAALETMRDSGEEPLARRLIREAGGQPVAEFFEVRASAP
jgi:hypothetical protein